MINVEAMEVKMCSKHYLSSYIRLFIARIKLSVVTYVALKLNKKIKQAILLITLRCKNILVYFTFTFSTSFSVQFLPFSLLISPLELTTWTRKHLNWYKVYPNASFVFT